jgi:hypothetical protein
MIKFDRLRLIFGLFILACIVITELVCERLKLPAWPAYAAWILFFIEHMNPAKASHILVGAVCGIGVLLLAAPVIGALAPSIGFEWARLVYILAAVYAIVAFGEIVPLIFNNYMFMFFTISGVASAGPNPNPIVWAIIAAVGGGLLIGASILFGNFLGLHSTKPPPIAHG